MHPPQVYDEITGLPYVPSGPPQWVVTLGFLAYSTHSSAAAARAWMRWNLSREQQAYASIVEM